VKALTIWQPWAHFVVIGAKPWEFRRWPAFKYLIGQRIVIHAGARQIPPKELLALRYRVANTKEATSLKRDVVLPMLQEQGKIYALPHGAGVGTAIMGTPVRCGDLFHGQADSDRIDHHMWAWPMLEVEHWAKPIPSKGAQGFWEWPYKTAAQYEAAGYFAPASVKQEEPA
jgi:hypothetical protein